MSKTILEKSINSSRFNSCTTLAMAAASSMPGGGVSRISPSRSFFSWSVTPPRPMPSRKSSNSLPLSPLPSPRRSSLAASMSISRPHTLPSVPMSSTGSLKNEGGRRER